MKKFLALKTKQDEKYILLPYSQKRAPMKLHGNNLSAGCERKPVGKGPNISQTQISRDQKSAQLAKNKETRQ
jgi:hypothetical protein